MSFFRKFITAVFALSIISIAAPLSARAQEKWSSVRSENFRLVGNATEPQLRRTAKRLEQFRFVFTRLFTELNFVSPIPTTVVVFKDEKSFESFKPLNDDGTRRDLVVGYFLPGKDVNYIALPAGDEKSFGTIYHEYVHFLVDNTLGRTSIPPWFNEGFAEYSEQFAVEEDRRARLGNLNREHLTLLQKSDLLAFDKFFATDYYTLHRQPKENVANFYAQSWALVHFLMQRDKEAKTQKLYEFGKLLLGGKSHKEAFLESFRLDYAQLEKELKTYIEKKSFQTFAIDFEKNSVFEPEMQSAALTEAEAKTFQGDLLFHAGRIIEAKKHLRDALALNPELSFANNVFGLLEMQENNFVEAEKYLEKAVRSDAQNYLAHYGYAYALSRNGMTDFGFVVGYNAAYAEKIRQHLRRAMALNPKFAESYQLYAFINAVRNENIDEGLVMINRALQIAPGNQLYQLRVAELLMRKENFSAARMAAQKVLQTAPDDQMKLYAQNVVNQINAWEAQLEDIKNDKKRMEDEAVTDKPLSEEEIARLNEIAMLKSLNESLRRPKTGEKRVLGFLTKVDCESNVVFYSVKVGGEYLKLKSNSVGEVVLINFAPDYAKSQIGCETVKNEIYAVVTFRPNGDARTDIAGDAIAIEFVPQRFKFTEAKTEK